MYLHKYEGQTGSGKTYTMQGYGADEGLIPNSFKYIFEEISKKNDRTYIVSVAFLEIYNEEIRDLLCKQEPSSLELKEHPEQGFYVKDLSTHVVQHWKDMDELMATGNRKRTVASTLMNEQSSRSHSIFTISIESCSKDGNVVAGKLHLVDLAGSERQGKTGATGERLKEGTKINLSLAALGNCISALGEKKTHVPYRDSKLTKLLQDSLGGNSKTMMIATFSPADYNYEETIGTLRYANRAKNIKNKPKINMDPKEAKIKEYQDQIRQLKALLEARGNGVAPPMTLKPLEKQVTPAAVSGISKQSKNGKQELEQNLREQQDKLENERRMREELQRQIQSIESKVIIGGVPIEERVHIQEKALNNLKAELDLKTNQEKELMKRMESRQSENVQLEEQFVSLQDEIDMKSRKLQKLWDKFEQLKLQRSQVAENFAQERLELQETMRDLTKELSLKEKLVSLLIPEEFEREFYQTASFDEISEAWTIRDKEMLPLSCFHQQKTNSNGVPVSLYTKLRGTLKSYNR